MAINRFDTFSINEGKFDSITRIVVNDIMMKLTEFIEDEEEDYNDELEYVLPKHLGLETEFMIDLYLLKSDINNYKIDADAPGEIDENDIRVVIYITENEPTKLLDQIYFNLIYTIRHEIEHLIQVYSDHPMTLKPKKYSRITAREPRKYKNSTLLKKQEIEPQVYGYYLQAKKENKPFEEVIKSHLNKLIQNGQYEFEDKSEYDYLIKTIIRKAKKLGLNIK